MSTKHAIHLICWVNVGIAAFCFFLGHRDGNLAKFTDEGTLLTWLSFLQLLLIAGIAFFIYAHFYQKDKSFSIRSSHLIWLIVTIGFVFLAFDEMFLIHERLDFAIHSFFNIEETSLTDRIDDLIVTGYAILGFFILSLYRNELKEYGNGFAFFRVGFVLLVGTISLDVLNGGGGIFLGSFLPRFDIFLEEIFKTFSEAMFLIFFLLSYKGVQDQTA